MKRAEMERYDGNSSDDSDPETVLPRLPRLSQSVESLSSSSPKAKGTVGLRGGNPGSARAPATTNVPPSAAFGSGGSGRGWEAWDREEGHRALGQSYQRHTNVLRDSDACNDEEFNDDRRADDDDHSGSHSGSSRSGSRSTGSRSSRPSSSTSDEGLSVASGKSGFFSRAICPSVEGLKNQARGAKRRRSFGALSAEQHRHRVQFMEEMEKGGPAPKIGAVPSDGKGAARMSKRKKICLTVMVLSSVILVVGVCIPNSPFLAFLREKEEQAREATIGGDGWIKSLFASSSGSEEAGKTKDDKVNKPRGTFSSANAGSDSEGPDYEPEIQDSQPLEQQKYPLVESLNRKGSSLVLYNTAQTPEDPGIFVPGGTTESFMSVWETPTDLDRPMFWKIHKSGGSAIEDMVTKCLGMVAASDVGVSDGHGEETELTINTFKSADDYEVRYANVDTTTLGGIDRAHHLMAIQSGKIDIVFTPFFHPAHHAFDRQHRARIMTLLRDPVDLAVSTYFYYQTPEGMRDPSYHPTLRTMSLERYANSDFVLENYLVRSLTGDFTGEVSQRHVETAKEVLRRKVVVGLLEDFDASLIRFLQYFGWWKTVSENPEIMECQQKMAQMRDRTGDHERAAVGTPAYEALKERNWADLQLWEDARLLFQEQEALI